LRGADPFGLATMVLVLHKSVINFSFLLFFFLKLSDRFTQSPSIVGFRGVLERLFGSAFVGVTKAPSTLLMKGCVVKVNEAGLGLALAPWLVARRAQPWLLG
jgi:hypothetical protein